MALLLVCGIANAASATEPTPEGGDEAAGERVTADMQRAAHTLEARRRADAHERRRLGWTLLVPGAALVGGAGVLWWLSARVDDEIQGGLPTIQAYEDAEARGQLENGLAWACGVAGLIGIGVGLPLVLTGDPEAPGVAVSGRW